jgi:hypothetical protein
LWRQQYRLTHLLLLQLLLLLAGTPPAVPRALIGS